MYGYKIMFNPLKCILVLKGKELLGLLEKLRSYVEVHRVSHPRLTTDGKDGPGPESRLVVPRTVS